MTDTHTPMSRPSPQREDDRVMNNDVRVSTETPSDSGSATSLADELDQLLRDLDRDIARAKPICQASGRCCRFDEYGHTLFLSQTEADRLLENLPAGTPVSRGRCPFQINGLCTAREERPIGCRAYFCDPDFAQGQIELSEKYLGRLKDLHRRHLRPWRYQPLHVFLEEWAAAHPPAENIAKQEDRLVVLREFP
jgi:hypothetical protein